MFARGLALVFALKRPIQIVTKQANRLRVQFGYSGEYHGFKGMKRPLEIRRGLVSVPSAVQQALPPFYFTTNERWVVAGQRPADHSPRRVARPGVVPGATRVRLGRLSVHGKSGPRLPVLRSVPPCHKRNASGSSTWGKLPQQLVRA